MRKVAAMFVVKLTFRETVDHATARVVHGQVPVRCPVRRALHQRGDSAEPWRRVRRAVIGARGRLRGSAIGCCSRSPKHLTSPWRRSGRLANAVYWSPFQRPGGFSTGRSARGARLIGGLSGISCAAGVETIRPWRSTDASSTKPTVVGYLRDRQAHGHSARLVSADRIPGALPYVHMPFLRMRSSEHASAAGPRRNSARRVPPILPR